MVNLIKEKNCETIANVEVPTDLLSPTGKKRKEQNTQKNQGNIHTEMTGGENAPKKKAKTANIMPQYNAQLKDFFEQPLKDAGYPGLNRIC